MMDGASTFEKGLGLLGIQERVTRLGGQCKVHSQPGYGTILSVELPFLKEMTQKSQNGYTHETNSHPVG
jgi:signal transduction histidine kinase